MFIISAYPESVNYFFLFFKKIIFMQNFNLFNLVFRKNLILRGLSIHFCGFVLPFRRFTPVFLPFPTPKHRLCNRNFSLLLCIITLKLHKNKFFCIRHFTLFEQICYKSCKNIKLYLCFLQIILYIYSLFCKIMPYYAHPLYPPRSSCLDKRILIYARTRMHTHNTYARIYTRIYAHTIARVHARVQYIWCFWLSCLARIYKYGYWRCKR